MHCDLNPWVSSSGIGTIYSHLQYFHNMADVSWKLLTIIEEVVGFTYIIFMSQIIRVRKQFLDPLHSIKLMERDSENFELVFS